MVRAVLYRAKDGLNRDSTTRHVPTAILSLSRRATTNHENAMKKLSLRLKKYEAADIAEVWVYQDEAHAGIVYVFLRDVNEHNEQRLSTDFDYEPALSYIEQARAILAAVELVQRMEEQSIDVPAQVANAFPALLAA